MTVLRSRLPNKLELVPPREASKGSWWTAFAGAADRLCSGASSAYNNADVEKAVLSVHQTTLISKDLINEYVKSVQLRQHEEVLCFDKLLKRFFVGANLDKCIVSMCTRML